MAERISGKTKLTGLLGRPVSHSISPKIHNESFAKLGLDYAYLAFDVEDQDLGKVVEGLKAMNARGWNVTMPHKTAICEFLDKLSPAAKMAGAVNTVVNDNGVLTGHITDGTGYMMSLKDANIDIIGKKMTISGAGGAATAICIQAALDGVKEISIFNREDEFFERAKQTVKDINKQTDCVAKLFTFDNEEDLRREIAESAIFVNGTSVGMHGSEDMCVIPNSDMLHPELIVSDVIYKPAETKLLKMAKEKGCKIINGEGMLLFQGAKAFEIWTGEEMPVNYIKEIL